MTDRPHIWIARSDYRRLMGLTAAADALLGEELERARICQAAELPDAVVCMGARVLFRRDEDADAEWGVLVYPDQMAAGYGAISVTSPVGAAMIGLRQGASMAYVDAQGVRRCLVIERVIAR